jgi:hypothetical protein
MLAGGRIHHENLRFSVADLVDVQSHGTVGLDETLDLQTALGIHPPRAEERRLAILRVLTSQPWPVNIRGTLGKPEVDFSPLNDAWKQLVFQKLPQDWQSGRGSIGEQLLRGISGNTGLPVDPETVGPLLQMLGPLLTQPSPGQPTAQAPPVGAATDAGDPQTGPRQPPPPQPAPPMPTASATGPSTAEAIADGVGTAIDVLEALRARRQATLQNRQTQQPPIPVAPPGMQPPPVGPPPRRPLLNGLRNLLEPPPAQPTATSPAPVPAPPAANPPTSTAPAPKPKNPA